VLLDPWFNVASIKSVSQSLVFFAVIVYTNGLIPFLSSGQSRSALHRLAMMQMVKRRYDRGHREPLFKLLLATRSGLAHDPRDFCSPSQALRRGTSHFHTTPIMRRIGQLGIQILLNMSFGQTLV
jgi:hypothetical protein